MKLNYTFALVAALLLNSVHIFAQVFVNEGSNRNYALLSDEDGEYPDWIELYNSGNSVINLENYSLTDKSSNPDKWIFPSTELAPGAYLTIFCSGKDRTPETGFTPVAYSTGYTPQVGWNTHPFYNNFYWDGVSSILINTCSYSSAGYTTNSVFNQTTTEFLSTVFAFQDGGSDACNASQGNPVFQRPNLKLNGITIGTGTVQNSATTYPAPYGNWYWCARNQMLIRPEELTEAGFSAGFITNIAFDVVATDPNTVYSYVAISMKLTTENAVSSHFFSTSPTNTYHTNFKISGDGETISLFKPDQTLESSLLVFCDYMDVTRGCFPDGSSNKTWFLPGTPGYTNNSSQSFSGYLESPSFSLPSGYYNFPVTVNITNPNGPSSTVHYTTDGNTPTQDSPLYEGTPIEISETTVLKAKVFEEGLLPGFEAVGTYFFNVNHSTPVLSVITDNANLYGGSGIFDNWWTDWEKAAYIEYFDSTKQLIFSQRAGMQIDGGAGGSRSNPQHSFRLEPANGTLGDGVINYPLIPDRPDRTAYSKFYLRNGSNQYLQLPYKDAAQVTSMSNGTDNYYSAWRPVTVFINGEYFGLYELREKFDLEFFETYDDADPDQTTILSQSYWYGGMLRAVEGDIIPFYSSVQYLNSLDGHSEDYWDLIDAHFDLNHYIDYIIGESWMGNTDWPWNNIKIYRSDATNFRWRYCLIDQELAMQPNGWTDAYFDHIEFMMNQDPTIPHINIWLKGIQNQRFKNYFINRFADIMNTSYQYENISNIVSNMYELTLDEMPNEFARWGDPNNIAGQMAQFTNNQNIFLDQLSLRTEQVRQHILYRFGLPHLVDVSLDIFPVESGKIKISTITPESYPWEGVYFNGVPVAITAIPEPGYAFSHWENNPLISDTLNPEFLNHLNANDIVFKAHFIDETTNVPTIGSKTDSFILYPNPTSDILYLAHDNLSGVSYQVIDLNGAVLMEGSISTSVKNISIDVSSLSPSVYMFRIVQAGEMVMQQRFIKI